MLQYIQIVAGNFGIKILFEYRFLHLALRVEARPERGSIIGMLNDLRNAFYVLRRLLPDLLWT